MVGREVEFDSHAGAGGVGEREFAVGGVLELAAARGQAHHHLRQLRLQIRGVALAAHLVHLGLFVGVERGLQIRAVLGGDFGQGVGLELVDDVAGGGFQQRAADVNVGAHAIFSQCRAVGGIFQLGLALDVMDLGEQNSFGGRLAAGVQLGIQRGLGRAAGVLADAVQIFSKLGHQVVGDDLVVLDFGEVVRVAGDAEDDVAPADFGELMFVQQAVAARGFVGGGGRGSRCWIAHGLFGIYGFMDYWIYGENMGCADMSALWKRQHVAAVHRWWAARRAASLRWKCLILS